MKPDVDRCSSRSEVVIPDEVYQGWTTPRGAATEGNHSSLPHGSIVMRTVFKAENSRDTIRAGYGRFSGGSMKANSPREIVRVLPSDLRPLLDYFGPDATFGADRIGSY